MKSMKKIFLSLCPNEIKPKKFNKKKLDTFLNIPVGEMHIIPQAVIKEFFSTKEYTIKPGKDLNISEIQPDDSWDNTVYND